ncbi:hypothetical protein FB451DRAFT_1176140 [Mycena latifolia]|nr:hypothetical protein FB451DRAFT_1176140 [Mycena latifolia]
MCRCCAASKSSLRRIIRAGPLGVFRSQRDTVWNSGLKSSPTFVMRFDLSGLTTKPTGSTHERRLSAPAASARRTRESVVKSWIRSDDRVQDDHALAQANPQAAGELLKVFLPTSENNVYKIMGVDCPPRCKASRILRMRKVQTPPGTSIEPLHRIFTLFQEGGCYADHQGGKPRAFRLPSALPDGSQWSLRFREDSDRAAHSSPCRQMVRRSLDYQTANLLIMSYCEKVIVTFGSAVASPTYRVRSRENLYRWCCLVLDDNMRAKNEGGDGSRKQEAEYSILAHALMKLINKTFHSFGSRVAVNNNVKTKDSRGGAPKTKVADNVATPQNLPGRVTGPSKLPNILPPTSPKSDELLDEKPYARLIRNREEAKLSIDSANAALAAQFTQLATRNDEIQEEIYQKAARLEQEEAAERVLAEAAAQNSITIGGLVEELKAEVGADRYDLWNKSRGVAMKTKPTLPVALAGVSGAVLKDYFEVDRPAAQPFGNGLVEAVEPAKGHSSKIRGGGGYEDVIPESKLYLDDFALLEEERNRLSISLDQLEVKRTDLAQHVQEIKTTIEAQEAEIAALKVALTAFRRTVAPNLEDDMALEEAVPSPPTQPSVASPTASKGPYRASTILPLLTVETILEDISVQSAAQGSTAIIDSPEPVQNPPPRAGRSAGSKRKQPDIDNENAPLGANSERAEPDAKRMLYPHQQLGYELTVRGSTFELPRDGWDLWTWSEMMYNSARTLACDYKIIFIQ